jgi:hypothetical protein
MDLRWIKPLIDRANQNSAGTRSGGERLAVGRYSVGGCSLRWREGRGLLFACALVCLTGSVALAQAANYKSVEAVPDKPIQLSYHASAHTKTCEAAAAPTVRVIEAPQAGYLTVRQAELTTDQIPGCPTLKTAAQVVFYTANAGYAGPDHTKYEVTSENGEVATYDVTITVKGPEPGQTPPAGAPGGEHL